MKIEETKVTQLIISDVPRLDPIRATLEYMGDGRGHLTVACYGKSWATYWGSMCDPLEDFIHRVSVDYIAGCMYHGEESEIDREATAEKAKREVFRLRRRHEVGQREARELYDMIGDEIEDPFSDVMNKIFGDDYWYQAVMKPHHEYAYLKTIITALKEAIAVRHEERVAHEAAA